MRSTFLWATCCLALTACMTTRPVRAPLPWEKRSDDLRQATRWQLDGRTAVAVGNMGWQASLDWQQNGDAVELHLAGPLGIGAMVLTRSPAGVSLNGAPPSEAVLAQVRERVGFDLPLDNLRYWLLGVPDPDSSFELQRNAQDRALKLVQAGWNIDYDRYMSVNGDWLPAHLVLTRADVRVRIVVDHWRGIG